MLCCFCCCVVACLWPCCLVLGSSRDEVTIVRSVGGHQPLCAAPSPIPFSRPYRSTTVRYGCAIPHDGFVTSLHSQSTLLVPILSREGSGYGSSSASERASVFTACCFHHRGGVGLVVFGAKSWGSAAETIWPGMYHVRGSGMRHFSHIPLPPGLHIATIATDASRRSRSSAMSAHEVFRWMEPEH